MKAAQLLLERRREAIPWWNWWQGLAWKPAYSAALIIIGIALIIGAALLLNRKFENQQAQQRSLGSPTPTPSNLAATLPSPTVSPHESPTEQPENKERVALNDQRGLIMIDKTGRVSGLDDVPAAMRDEIAQVLLSERIDRPRILKDLGGEDSALRESDTGQPFKLVSPSRTVIVSDRPTFKWEKVSRATSYSVYITDKNGKMVSKCSGLTAEHKEWRIPNPLKRGEIYEWTVAAVVGDEEIISPGPSAPEMKFQVLSNTNLSKLNKLKKTRSHLASIGHHYRNQLFSKNQTDQCR